MEANIVDSEPLQMDFKMFEPLIVKWLNATSQKTLDWVDAAVSVDTVRLCRSVIAF
jgi:hypothetical protein